MSELDHVRETMRVIETCLEESDWETLATLDPDTPPSDAAGATAESLSQVLAEIEQLQRRVEVAMGTIRDEIDEVPRMRRAARAYTPHA